MIDVLTPLIIPWLMLAAAAGFGVGWWVRGRHVTGRELTLQRRFNNRVTAIEEDARRVLQRVKADCDLRRRKIEIERDRLHARLSRLDTRGAPPRRAAAAGPAAYRPAPARPSATRSGANAPAEPAESDDLKRIKGIGPAYEERLRQLGYRTFRDIAHWDATDFEALGEGFGARVRLVEWAARAAELHREKYGAET